MLSFPEMALGSIQALLFAIFVTVSVTLFSPLSKAAGLSCSWVYSKPSIYTTSYGPIREFLVPAYELLTQLKTASSDQNAAGILKAEAINTIARIQALTESYFESGGIGYKKEKQVFTMELADGTLLKLPYNAYSIRGKEGGDELSTLLLGAKRHKLAAGDPPKFLYDLFYELKESDSGAHYFADNHLVEFGPRVIESFVTAIGNEVSHEVRHYFEERKVRLGEHTLARIGFTGGKKKEGDPYSEDMALDELETNLADLQKLADKNRMAEVDSKLAERISAEKVAGIRQVRADLIPRRISILEQLFARADSNLKKLHKAIESNDVKFSGSYASASLGKGEFSEVNISLVGTTQTRKKAILEIVLWSQRRTTELYEVFDAIRKEQVAKK